MFDVEYNKLVIVGVAGVFVAIAIAGVALLTFGNTAHMPDLSSWGSGLLSVLVILAVVVVAVWAIALLRDRSD
jgi:hypothetical protein